MTRRRVNAFLFALVLVPWGAVVAVRILVKAYDDLVTLPRPS